MTSNSTPSRGGQMFNATPTLHGLPAEIRRMILKYLICPETIASKPAILLDDDELDDLREEELKPCITPSLIPDSKFDILYEARKDCDIHLSIMRTCRQMYLDGKEVLIGQTKSIRVMYFVESRENRHRPPRSYVMGAKSIKEALEIYPWIGGIRKWQFCITTIRSSPEYITLGVNDIRRHIWATHIHEEAQYVRELNRLDSLRIRVVIMTAEDIGDQSHVSSFFLLTLSQMILGPMSEVRADSCSVAAAITDPQLLDESTSFQQLVQSNERVMEFQPLVEKGSALLRRHHSLTSAQVFNTVQPGDFFEIDNWTPYVRESKRREPLITQAAIRFLAAKFLINAALCWDIDHAVSTFLRLLDTINIKLGRVKHQLDSRIATFEAEKLQEKKLRTRLGQRRLREINLELHSTQEQRDLVHELQDDSRTVHDLFREYSQSRQG